MPLWRTLHREAALGPAQQLRSEHRGMDGEPLRGVGGVICGEGLDPVEAVGDRVDGHRQTFPGLLVGAGDPVRARVGTTDADAPRPAAWGALELAEHEVAERL